ncbi:MAG: hypothetical protein LBT10_03210 [Methanobrevibacter sp.]|nr:hypothetical protein [Methanobrevibacter sp.]
MKTNFNSIDKNDVIQYYITDNHTRKKSAKYFNLSEDQFRMQLKNNKIKKDQKLASDNSHKKYKIFISNISPEEVQLALDNGLTNNKI